MKHSQERTIGSQIRLGFVLVILAPTLASLGGFYFSHAIQEKSKQLDNNILHALANVTELHNLARLNYSRTLEYVLIDDPLKRSQIRQEINSNHQKVDDLSDEFEKSLVSAKGKELFADLVAKRDQWVEARNAILDLADRGTNEQCIAQLQSQVDPAFFAFDAASDVMVKQKMGIGESFVEEVNDLGHNMSSVVSISTIISILIAAGVGWQIIRRINSRLSELSSSMNHGTLEVQGAAQNLTASSEKLADGASEQASTLEQISASLEELSSIARQNHTSVQSAQKLATEARESAEMGARDVKATSQLGTEISSSSESMTKAMEDVQTCSTSISRIIKTIDEIAFQTNILALNAAVVADEVRNLAQRSAQAARETAEMIESSVSKSNFAANIGFKVAERIKEMTQLNASVDARLAEILQKTQKTNQLVTEVSTASNEQTLGVEQVSKAVQQLDELSQHNASEASSMSQTAQQLDASASRSKSYCDHLGFLITGNSKHLNGFGDEPLRIAAA